MPPLALKSSLLIVLFSIVVTPLVAQGTKSDAYCPFSQGMGDTHGVLALSKSSLPGIKVVILVGPIVPPNAIVLLRFTHTLSPTTLPVALMSFEK